jgi:pimeloyl-ACP methyl ester carboxylesterase
VNPFYFGTAQRRLFGIYIPARVQGANTRAVVLCHPWGHEYLGSHRSMRALGSMLSAAGFHVLRFDYFGTGDSAGDMREASLEGWRSDIGMAIDELRDTTGAARVGLAGLRLGATLAAEVAAARPREVDALALWDPVISGDSHVAELMASSLEDEGPRPAPANGAAREVGGFPLTEDMELELRAIDLPAGATPVSARTLVVVSTPTGECEELRPRLAGRFRGPLGLERIVAAPAWVESVSFGTGAVPIKVLQRMVEWLR